MKVSLIIPALNEEHHLPILLKSIKKQNFKDYEVIVANSPRSADRTEEIAKSYGAKVIEGGFLCFARNNGAKNAKGDIFYFLDADTEFPDENYLQDVINLFEENNLDVGSTLVAPDEETKKSLVQTVSVYIWCICKKISGLLPKPFIEFGGSMLVRKDVFEKLGGYRENLANGIPEDLDLSHRSIKSGFKYKILNKKIKTSGRRFNTIPKAILRTISIGTLGVIAMKTNLHKNKKFVKFYQRLYGELGGKAPEKQLAGN